MDARDRTHQEEPEATRSADAPARPQPSRRVHALQRSAGNRAVSALLAREPDDATPADTRKADSGIGVVTLTGIGAIPVLSVSLGPERRPAGPSGGGASGDRDTKTQTATFSSRVGEHSVKLAQAVAAGTPVAGDIAISGAVVFKLAGAFLTSYSMSPGGGSDPTESFAIVFEPAA